MKPLTPKPNPGAAEESSSGPSTTARTQSQAGSAPSVLLVDDDPSLRAALSHILIRSGCRVDAAEDGEAGWKMLQERSSGADGYDLVITDNNMPRLSGVDLVKKMRCAGLTVPVIMATASTPADVEPLQIAAILEKPYGLVRLMQTVRQVLQQTKS